MPRRRDVVEWLADALGVDVDELNMFLEKVSPVIEKLVGILAESGIPEWLFKKQIYLQRIEKTVKNRRYTYIQICVKEHLDGKKREKCLNTRGDPRPAYLLIAREAAKIIEYLSYQETAHSD